MAPVGRVESQTGSQRSKEPWLPPLCRGAGQGLGVVRGAAILSLHGAESGSMSPLPILQMEKLSLRAMTYPIRGPAGKYRTLSGGFTRAPLV